MVIRFQLAYRYHLVIIADEIYGDLTYDGAVFHPLATLTPKVGRNPSSSAP